MSSFRFRFLALAAPLALALIASPALAQGTPWHLDAIDQRSLPYDNSYNPNGTGSGVNVYIVGSGLNHNHVEFGGRAQTSWSAFANSDDELGHGTWVASLVGGNTYGVAKSVSLRGVKVIDGCGTVNPADLVAGLDWVRTNGRRPAVAVLTFAFESTLEIDVAVANLVASGVPTVVPAGNVQTDACNLSPAGVPSAVTVGAHDPSLSIASDQAYGSCIDIYAPGVNIMGAWHTSNTATNTLVGPDTAAAAAIVAGALALYGGSQSAMMAAATSMGVWLRVYV